MEICSNGARGRNDATERNQRDRLVQPTHLTDGDLPSPEDGLSNLSGRIRERRNKVQKLLPYLKGPVGVARLERFWSYVDIRRHDECWPWTGGVSSDGYGSFKLASYRTVTASRLALIAYKMQEPEGLHVLHRCDNPSCCNPRHLRFGTVADNAQDKVSRGRARGRFSKPVEAAHV